jgi:fucose 4-O-acetylase-like acetyltransferase
MPGPRLPLLDIGKGILIILVIWGHLIEQAVGQSQLAAAIYGAIYLFHIPAFALISGMVSDARLDGGIAAKLVRKLLVPLLVFQMLYWPALTWLKPGWTFEALAPNWILWFLLSLLLWRLMLPAFLHLRFPLTSAVVLAIAVGFVEGFDHTLSLSRTFVFFPAFLFGFLRRQGILDFIQSGRRAGAAVLVVLSGSAGLFIAQGGSILPLYGSVPYAIQPYGLVLSVALRLAVIVAGIGAAIAFLSVVPKEASFLSSLGRQTVPVYLLHGFLVLAFWAVAPSALESHFGFIALTACLSFLIALGLAYFSRLFSAIVSGAGRTPGSA